MLLWGKVPSRGSLERAGAPSRAGLCWLGARLQEDTGEVSFSGFCDVGRATYFCWKGDLKARKEVHGFKRWYQCLQCLDSGWAFLKLHTCASGCVTNASQRNRPRTHPQQ